VPRVVQAEHNRAGTLSRKVPDLRIVPVHDEHRTRIEALHDRPPTLGHVLQLAVPVELVPKQVPQADRPRPHTPRDLR
jgi:hypothetical protein